ncbi:MAG: phosphatidylinositol-specific phospholipase C/glycerophosphodiester phosphodiesterase family protein [Opitutaceae bacterium]|nr:phosphatidylinositol-specific phospholipase C/glycerophosphodiester phosphodiesterase family protein [Opitutaceae bacterium]
MPDKEAMMLRLAVFALTALGLAAADPKVLTRAHAHNDYSHARPLAEALERGFGSVEADIWLVDGALLVAHDRKDVNPERTLASLYLDPLRERVGKNGGRVYADGPPLVLLVDVKSEAVATYAVLQAQLASYAPMLTTYREGHVEPRAVTVIVSGNRAQPEMAAQTVRHAFVDGRAIDLESNPPATLVPWVSENWQKVFPWRWEGPMPAETRVVLAAWIARAHGQGRRVRFWNTPDRPAVWQALSQAGVDFIGTDDLAGLQQFLAVGRTR